MPEKVRLAVVAGYPPDAHGEAHYSGQAYNLLAEKFRDEVEVTVYAHTNDSASDEADHPLVKVVRMTGGATRAEKTASVQRLSDDLVKSAPDVVHMQGTTTGLYGGMYGEPILKMVKRLNGIGVPSMLTLHATWLEPDLDELWQSKRLPRFARSFMTSRYSSFIRVLVDELKSFRILVSGEDTPSFHDFCTDHGVSGGHVVGEPHPCKYDPVDAARQDEALKKLGLEGRKLVFAGGFVRADKALHLLIEALPLLDRDDVTVVIAGKPSGASGESYAEQLQESVIAAGLEEKTRLIFRFLSDEEMSDYFDAASVVAIPYARAVGASGPIHHAVGRGKTVLASAVGQNRGLKGTIELFEPGDVGSLCSVLERILSEDPEALKNKALCYAKGHTWDLLADSYMSEYRELTK